MWSLQFAPWFDATHVQAIRDVFPEWMALVFAALSFLGSVYFVVPVVVLAYWFGDRRRFAPWIGIVAGGYALMAGTKALIDVPRADVGPALEPEALPTLLGTVYSTQVHVTDASFPSGHALAATLVWTMLALELDVGTRRHRFAGACTMIALVAVSRLGNGLHYPIDVAGGVALGLGYLAVMLALVAWADRDRTGERLSRIESGGIRPTGNGSFGSGSSRVRPEPWPTICSLGVAAILAIASWWVTRGTTEAGLIGVALGGVVGWLSLQRPHLVARRNLGYTLVGGYLVGVVAGTLVSDSVVWFVAGVGVGVIVLVAPRRFESILGGHYRSTLDS